MQQLILCCAPAVPAITRVVYILQNGALLVFSICWVAVLDYLVFMFTCSWGINNKHIHWHDTGEPA